MTTTSPYQRFFAKMQKASILALQYESRTNGIATITDNELWLSRHCDDNGPQTDILDIEGHVATDIGPDDMPTQPKAFAGLENAKSYAMPVNILESLYRYTSENETRYYLQGVYIAGNTMTATDGHRIIQYTMPGLPDWPAAILNRRAIKMAIDIAKHGKFETVTLKIGKSIAKLGRVATAIRIGAHNIKMLAIDAQYPNAQLLLDNALAVKNRHKICSDLSPKLFDAMLKAHNTHNRATGKPRDKMPALTFKNNLAIIGNQQVDFPKETPFDVRVNANFWLDIPQGATVTAGVDELEPLLFTGDAPRPETGETPTYIGLLMPMRGESK